MRKKKGFTLIELLAVIVILAIIALIATPIVMNVIENVRKGAFEETVNGIVRTAKNDSVLELPKVEEIAYEYQDGEWIQNSLGINGKVPKYIGVRINKQGEVKYAISDGVYCALKEYDSEKTITKFDDDFTEDYCSLNPYVATEESCFSYSESNGVITLTSYRKHKGNDSSNELCPTDVVIPKSINGQPVTSIKYNMFASDRGAPQITGITIPEGVTSIGSNAFYGQKSLTHIKLPSTLQTIGDRAFQESGIKDITIPEGVTSIGSYAFSHCAIENIKLPTTMTSIVDYAFYASGLKSIEIPNNITTIGDYAFDSNNLTNITIPSGVKTIGDYAFQNNELETIFINDTVTSIGIGAFLDNKMPNDTAFIYNRNSDGSIDNTSLNSYAGKQRGSITIPSGVKTVGDYALYSSDLTNVIIPSGVETIGDYAFASNNLTSISISNTVTSIGIASFLNNKMPNDTAFIYNRNSDGSINYKSLNSYAGAQRDTVVIPSGVETIGDYAFRFLNLKNITIPDSIVNIGSHAFAYNYLTDVMIPDSVQDIGNQSFAANDIANLTLGSNVNTIGNSAFSGNKLKELVIPSSVSILKEQAFNNNKLEKVQILGKASKEDFEVYERPVAWNLFGWASGYSDSNIEWELAQ